MRICACMRALTTYGESVGWGGWVQKWWEAPGTKMAGLCVCVCVCERERERERESAEILKASI